MFSILDCLYLFEKEKITTLSGYHARQNGKQITFGRSDAKGIDVSVGDKWLDIIPRKKQNNRVSLF